MAHLPASAVPPDPATPLQDFALDARAFEVFADALDVPAAERTAFVDAACGGNADLNRRIRSLLAADAEATGFMDGRAPVPVELAAGQRIGAYRIVEPIGEGGMGMVYRAERADGAFDQDVAVKLLRVGIASQEAAARFEHERRLLARLEHPHVVRLLDGGVVTDGALAGRPFLVMELVRGVPLTDYADRLRLGVEARLRLFLDVCDAVAHAHRRLVVHRDLKPSNVLVADADDGTAQVKLLDFGIAKALAAEDDAALTRTGTPLLTPAYAAPEQISGDLITTATDVYALGVVLYELLAGRRPYEVGTGSIAEVARAVLTADPDRPSTAAGTPSRRSPEADALATGVAGRRGTDLTALRRELRGDLDAICLKALRKEPDRRYASAAELAADLRRHLRGEPVDAHRGTAGYRIGKFVRRHRAASAAALVATLGLVLGAGLALWQAREAEREAERARAALAYLGGMFERVDPALARDSTVIAGARALLTPALAGLDQLDGQPLVKADVLDGLGRLTQSLALFPTADSLHRAALALQAPGSPDAAPLYLRLGRSLTEQRRYAEADSALTLATAGFERASDPAGRAEAAIARADVGFRDGTPERGKPLLLGVLDADVSPELSAQAGLVLAQAYLAEDSLAQAEAVLRPLLRKLRREPGPAHLPDTRLAEVQAQLATVLVRQNQPDQAIPLQQDALATFQQVYGARDYRVATELYRLGKALRLAGRTDEALAAYRESAAVYAQSALGARHLWRAQPLTELAELLLGERRVREADPVVQEAFAIYEADTDLGVYDARRARVDLLLARVEHGSGRSATARALLLRSRSRLDESQRLLDDSAQQGPLSGWLLAYAEQVADVRRQVDAEMAALGP